MTRHRWYRTHWNVGIRDLAELLQPAVFTAGGKEGFVLERVRDDYLEARYVERLTYTETVLDPFGVEEFSDRTEYIQTRFRATSDQFGLELIDGSRGAGRLVSRLLELLAFNLSIAPVIVDVRRWAAKFEEESGLALRAEMIQIGGLELSHGALARVIVKGAKEVRETAAQFTGERPMIVEKLQVKLPKSGGILFSNSASVVVSAPTQEELLPFIRRALLAI